MRVVFALLLCSSVAWADPSRAGKTSVDGGADLVLLLEPMPRLDLMHGVSSRISFELDLNPIRAELGARGYFSRDEASAYAYLRAGVAKLSYPDSTTPITMSTSGGLGYELAEDDGWHLDLELGLSMLRHDTASNLPAPNAGALIGRYF